MQLSLNEIKLLAKKQPGTLTQLLKQAGVSRTAFYSLLKRPSVLPRSVEALAVTLGVNAKEILRELSPDEECIAFRIRRLEEILRKDPSLDRDTVWHTLILLERKPIERLKTALIRGKA